jgi:MFS family permease
MPRVSRASKTHIAASAAAVRAAATERLGATEGPDGTLVVPARADTQPAVEVSLAVDEHHGACTVSARGAGGIEIPFFAWFFRPLSWLARRREAAYVGRHLAATIAGEPAPDAPRPMVGLPPVAFGEQQGILLATASAATAIVSFAAALFGQLNGSIADTFGASDADMGLALALTRIGALFALAITMLADRKGRRRSILIGVAGSGVVCALSAVAPNLQTFTAVQILQRGFVITTATVAGIAVIEEAPDSARAYSATMLALAGGFGFSFAVVTLPLADIADWSWRLSFVIGALTLFLIPAIARHLGETTRYLALAERTDVVRGRVRDVWQFHKRRFILLGIIAFFTSVFNAPSSQFMNKYLEDVHDFSNTSIALFRTVTTAVPGLIGLIVGGRLAESRGRRPVAAIALALATATQMVFFLATGPTLWFASALSVVMAGAGGIALGTLDAELFPTEVRSTSNALLSVVAVIGSATGLGMAGGLSDQLGGLGRSIALTGIGSLLVAVLVIPLLPESQAHSLEDISPTHTNDPAAWRPDP